MAPECSLAATRSIARLGHLPVHLGFSFLLPHSCHQVSGSGFPAAIEETKWEAAKLSETQQQQLKLRTVGVFITKRYANEEGTKSKKR